MTRQGVTDFVFLRKACLVCNFSGTRLSHNGPFKPPLIFWLDFLTEYNKLKASLLLSFFHRMSLLMRWIFLS